MARPLTGAVPERPLDGFRTGWVLARETPGEAFPIVTSGVSQPSLARAYAAMLCDPVGPWPTVGTVRKSVVGLMRSSDVVGDAVAVGDEFAFLEEQELPESHRPSPPKRRAYVVIAIPSRDRRQGK